VVLVDAEIVGGEDDGVLELQLSARSRS